MRIADVEARNINRYRKVPCPREKVYPSAYVFAAAFPNVFVEPRYQPVLFKQRDEIRRREQPPLRMPPADQRLRAGQGAVPVVYLGLEIEYKLFAFQRRLHIAHKLLFVQQAGAQYVVVIGQPRVETALYGTQRQKRPVAHERNIHRRVGDAVDAD
ncbi:hypothetical protein SDC9_123508 [bioreactor metagenome]|uniref:Uncharacterized protein n=1 Tax=bioreactor metagenome TaxID=1076179 RepID=A0A645CHT9_9ZZZZ